MKKKLWIMVLALAMALAVTGCGGGNKPAENAAGGNNHNHEENHNHNHEGENHDHEGEKDHDHAHGDFEWIGIYDLKAGDYLFHFGPSPDETMDMGFVKMGPNVTDLEHHAGHLMATEDKEVIKNDSSFTPQPDFAYTFEMDPEHGHIDFKVTEDGEYAIVLQHLPSESNMQIFDAEKKEVMPKKEMEGAAHDHDHDHDHEDNHDDHDHE